MKRKKWFKFQALTSTVSCMLALVLIGMSVLGALTLQNMGDYLRQDFILTLTLGGSNDALLGASDATSAQTATMQANMQNERYVSSINLITADEVLMQQMPLIGGDPTDFEGFNPYYSEMEIGLQPAYVNTDSVNTITKEIQTKYPLVSEIGYEKDLLENLDQNVQKYSLVLMILTVVLVVILFALINNLVHMNIFAQRMQIRTMKLVGASRGFIYRLFLERSLGIGLVAGILASLALYGISSWLSSYDEIIRECMTIANLLYTCMIIMGIGILLLAISTIISVHFFLSNRVER